MSPSKLKAMIEGLLPYLMKSPPKIEPRAIPTIFDEDRTVV